MGHVAALETMTNFNHQPSRNAEQYLKWRLLKQQQRETPLIWDIKVLVSMTAYVKKTCLAKSLKFPLMLTLASLMHTSLSPTHCWWVGHKARPRDEMFFFLNVRLLEYRLQWLSIYRAAVSKDVKCNMKSYYSTYFPSKSYITWPKLCRCSNITTNI